ncbi:hypothetical protein BA062_27130 [Prauserella flavalba]|uniref:Fibronectin type-III domain-containing protein n=1 Tax=Prauserella flavalba TaxID=1477506 RepID=A0A318M1L1_9PSEU|nr:hypothetical protein BA062_27130 [Prauserella flavalba]
MLPSVTGRKLWHRLPMALLVAACAATVTIAISGAAQSPRGLDFAPAGHWVVNPELDVVFHVNGAAKSVDAQANLPIDPGDLVYQGETSAYVVGQARIREFGKSTLEVERTINAPTGEQPVGVEAPGGPYLVYREAGSVVRLGERPATIRAGEGLGDPVVTPDGTLWLHRQSSGVLCMLPRDADQVSCPTVTPPGHSGELTVVGEQAAFVDTTQDTVRAVSDGRLGDPVNVGVDLPGTAQVATADAGGRIPILDPAENKLHLLDGRGLTTPGADPRPVTVELPDGEYAAPESSGSSVVLLDLEGNTVRTYGNDGRPREVTPVAPETGEPRLTRGQDARVYVDGDKGGHVMVVDDGGSVSQVPLVGEEDRGDRPPQGPPPERTPEPPPAQPDRPSPPPSPPEAPDPGPVLAEPQPQGGQVEPPPAQPPAEPPPPPPSPPPSPPPAPATPPGIAPNVTATLQGDAVQVTWGAAADNGAPVTAYHVSWQPGAGAQTVPGGARSTVLTGLRKGTSHTITVVAENSAGRGPGASTTIAIPGPSITISRGEPSEYDGCGPPCYKIRVEATGLEPNTFYDFEVDSNHPTWNNPGSGWETDENGNAVFENIDFGEPGYEVWVFISELNVVSNRLLWPEG